MIKRILALSILAAAVNLAGCSGLPVKSDNTVRRETVSTQKKEEPTETIQKQAEEETFPEAEEISHDEELAEAHFQSTAYTVQMEVTTGLTTEYLGSLCNFPITVNNGEKETTINNQEELDAFGLNTIYTEALLTAIGDFDVDQLQIQDDTAVMGDKEKAYIVLGRDENGVIGIEEIHCGK